MSPSEGSGRRVRPKPASSGSNSNCGFAALASFDLNPRLLAHAGIGTRRSAIGLPIERQRHGRPTTLHRCDAALRELVDLELRYARDEAEMVVIPAPLVRTPPASGRFRNARFGSG